MSSVVTVNGRYELRAQLGVGGFGTVWLATDRYLARTVAVKLLTLDAPLAPADREAAIELFQREARALAALSHPNVVTAHDFGVDDDHVFLVMELVDGRSLADEVRHRADSDAPPMGVIEALRIADQILAGLAAAHAAGLVHGDLKPANLMLSGPTDQVKIVDFGLARIVERSQLSRTGRYMGTLPYMAPEQATSSDIDGRADLYALGCVLHELLAGRSPYTAGSTVEWIAAHAYAPPARLRENRPDAPEALEDLLVAMLRKAPADRPADAATIQARVREISRSLSSRTFGVAAVTPPAKPSLRIGRIADGLPSDAVTRGDIEI